MLSKNWRSTDVGPSATVDNLRLQNTASPLIPTPFANGLRLHHIGLAVPDSEKAAVVYAEWLDLKYRTMPFHDRIRRVRVAFVQASPDVFLELIEPADPVTPVSRFLEGGGGMHHLAFEVDDIDLAVAEYEEKGGRVLVRPVEGFENRRISFVLPVPDSRVVIEFVEIRGKV